MNRQRFRQWRIDLFLGWAMRLTWPEARGYDIVRRFIGGKLYSVTLSPKVPKVDS